MPTPSLGGLAVVLVVLSLVFGGLERLFPAVPGISILRRDRLPDFVYWFFTPLVSKVISDVALVVAVLLLASALGFHGPGQDRLAALLAAIRAHSPVARLAPAAQLLLALLVSDFFGYWSHRLFHRKTLWRFHAVHHSARQLDWFAATRLHPANDALSKLATTLPVLFLGVDPKIFTVVAPILVFYAIFEHANVPWGFGPLRYVISTPLFHRWHHTSQDEGLDKNFAGLFPRDASARLASRRSSAATRARRTRVLKGLAMKSSAPSSSPRASSISLSREVSRSTGTKLRSSRSFLQREKPSRPGMLTSETTTSGRRSRMAERPARPSRASSTR